MAINVNDVHKKFRIYIDKGHSLKEKMLFRKRRIHNDFWALKGINFQVSSGESFGIIGENGSGKSTLLKLLTRIMYPTTGSIDITGRVSSLIELGAGFHPHMTGRENIYINASIFGLSRKEIKNREQEIIDFSELEHFIDNPVRTYSSGMYMRLAFSIAINVNADILLIDEIISVGDLNFQKKCFDRFEKIKKEGITIVLVTHDINKVREFCTNAIWICKGEVKSYGISHKVVDDYLTYMQNK
jgi:ABC-2 type transport system ATP-binding protein